MLALAEHYLGAIASLIALIFIALLVALMMIVVAAYQFIKGIVEFRETIEKFVTLLNDVRDKLAPTWIGRLVSRLFGRFSKASPDSTPPASSPLGASSPRQAKRRAGPNLLWIVEGGKDRTRDLIAWVFTGHTNTANTMHVADYTYGDEPALIGNLRIDHALYAQGFDVLAAIGVAIVKVLALNVGVRAQRDYGPAYLPV